MRTTPRFRSFSRRVVWAALGIALLMAMPAVSPASHSEPPVPSAATGGATPSLSGHLPGVAAGHLPGASGGGRAIDAAALYRTDHTATFGGPNASRPGRQALPPTIPASPFAPTPLRPSNGGGWLTGTVLDSRYLTPVVGASVSVTTGVCTYCHSGTTNATGDFVVEGDAGPARIDIVATNYVVNRSFPTIVLGSFTSLGTLLLVHEATVHGVVVADLPSHPPILNVSVSSTSRDGGLIGPDSNLTAPNGSFSIWVDPLPIEVDFGPPFANFLGNASFVDPIPWQVLDVGTVALEGNVSVNLSVVDSVTGQNVSGASAWFCSDRIDNGCLYGAQSADGSVLFPALAGAGFVNVVAGGYMTNVTQLADVPSGTAGPVKLGTVRLLPVGAVEVTVNFTGGMPIGTWPSALPNGSGEISVVVCPLSGENGASGGDTELAAAACDMTDVKLGVTTLVPAPPLRDVVMVARGPVDYPVPNGFPLAELPVPGLLKNFRLLNETWANVTPGLVTYVGTVDVSPGTYLSGTVVVSGSYSTEFATSATITVCSMVRGSECLPPVMTSATGQLPPVPAGCPTGAWVFCVPAPPGPDHVGISWGPDSGGTWITVPTRCCAQEGNPTPIGTFSFSAELASLHGSVGVEGAPIGSLPSVTGAGVGVEACPANPLGGPCFQGTYNATNGSFWSYAELGWDQVTISAGGYRSNSTWVDVTSNNTTGVIEVGPVAYVGGQVLSATTGYPVLEAQIVACIVANPNACTSVGTTYGSNGTYNGSVGVTPYPASAVAFEASATGYDTETTFANLTPGTITTVPTIRLAPIGVAAVPQPTAARSANSSTPTTGSWVIGRALDARSGLAVGDARISLCYLSGAGGCQLTSSQTLADGAFNLTTVHGSYQMWVNGSHYVGLRVYLNASTAGTVDLGSVLLTPLDRITGRILVGPWGSLGAHYGEGADQVRISGCDPRMVCGPIEASDTGGFFNVSVPAGAPDTITLTGGGIANAGNGDPGFSPSSFALPVSSSQVTVAGGGPGGGVLFLILGGLTGSIRESSGGNTAAAFFATYGTLASASAGPSITALTGTSGNYTAFLPDGAYGEQVNANAQGLVPAQSTGVAGTTTAGSVVPGPNLTLTRFGFVDATVLDNTTLFPAVGLTVDVVGSGGPLNQALSGGSVSNGTGSVNISAPPGTDAIMVRSTAFANWSSTVSVSAGSATAFGQIRLTEVAGGGVVLIRTVDVNTVATPPTPGVYDNVTFHPVEGTYVFEDSGNGTVHAGPANGNDLGQFLLSGLPDSATNVSVAATGFTTFQTGVDLPPGSTYVQPRLNLTADGIVEGTVE
ncbi:MAG: hypothetical protein L3K05_03785, partial [Thermoplasmata archaeon]|nr:hypothetical protein [Thermoplasmata archaeon]